MRSCSLPAACLPVGRVGRSCSQCGSGVVGCKGTSGPAFAGRQVLAPGCGSRRITQEIQCFLADDAESAEGKKENKDEEKADLTNQ